MNEASEFALTEMGRIVATVLAIAVTLLALKLIQRRAQASAASGQEMSHRRGNYVLMKNLVLLVAVIVIGTVWASKIAGAALSLAAVAGAMLIVSKEFLANLLGTAHLAVTRPYRIGDFIEIDGVSGRVVDSDLLSTTISEMQDGSQITSRSVALPNSLLLVKPVRNLSATGAYVINMMKVAVDSAADLDALESALLKAAMEVCAPWMEDADRHLKQIESRHLLELPSAAPKVILQLADAKAYMLSLRYTCRLNDKVKVEQAILRRYLEKRSGRHGKASPGKEMEAGLRHF